MHDFTGELPLKVLGRPFLAQLRWINSLKKGRDEGGTDAVPVDPQPKPRPLGGTSAVSME